ncbi:hypothetical protein A6770_15435 [Nostoc minutum NIES-26]|uniref:Uncharacterized protein n=1 Tax=Nostoc minutum NIES-26 TaxID=1844469 RepID=A0A367RMD4_9NOSO|nr:hypothetical protein A6770_15435 [Nostoc minutum NIES-26]
MPHRHYPPAYLRYLKARLWNLAKPSFWGTAIFLSVVGLVIREYWSNPDVFAPKQNKEVTTVQSNNSSLSAEDKAIAADIDNLPALYSDLQQVTLPVTVSNSKENQANKSKSVLDVINKQQSSKGLKSNSGLGTSNDTPVPKEKNPFVLQAENLLQFGTLDSGNQLSSVKSLNASSESTGITQTSSRSGIGLVNQTDKSQNRNSISSLQAPLNQSANQPLSSFNGASLSQPNTFGYDSYGGIQTPYTNGSLNQTYSPTTGLNTGTGYIQPTVPNQTLNTYNNLNNSQVLPSQIFSPNTRLDTGTGYIQPTVTNQTLNTYNNLNNGQALPSQTFSPNTRLDTGTGYIQPTVTNQTLNTYNNLNNGQVLPGQVKTTPVTQPANSVAPSNISPFSIQTLNPNIVTSTTPVVPNNYGNYIWQRSNFSVPRQIPGQYTGGVQSNGYSYP